MVEGALQIQLPQVGGGVLIPPVVEGNRLVPELKSL